METAEQITEKKKKRNNYAWPIIWATLLFSFGYAIIRYHVAGDVEWKDFPFFISNKAISLSAFVLLTINFALGPLTNLGIGVSGQLLRSRRLVGIMGFIQVFIHMLMSFMLFRPAVYGKFFEADGTLTLLIGLSMLTGVIAFVFLWIYNVSFSSELRKDKDLITFITSRRVLLIAMFMAGAHLFFMGYKGWLNPGGWHGMPPISLVAFTFFSVGYVINLLGRR